MTKALIEQADAVELQEEMALVQFELDYLASLSEERKAIEQLQGSGALLWLDVAELFEQEGLWKTK